MKRQWGHSKKECKYLIFQGVKTPEPILMCPRALWRACPTRCHVPAQHLLVSTQCLPCKDLFFPIIENTDSNQRVGFAQRKPFE